MKRNACLFSFCLLLATTLHAQIDTIPFTLDKKVFVFTGKLNGANVDFAFDTGAGLGVANTSNQAKANFMVGNSNKKVNDSNGETTKLSNVAIEDLSIGSFHFPNVKSVFSDMDFLQCNGLYLLGMNVISKLNWKINFDKKELYISKTPFAIDNNFVELPVKNMNQRPTITLQINEETYKDCLIDFGYNGVMEIAETAHLNQLYLSNLHTNISIGSGMGLHGLGKPDTIKTLFADSILWQETTLFNVPINIKEKIQTKVGVYFFSTTCNNLIINNNSKNYYLQLKSSYQFNKSVGFDARVSLINEKLIVTAKSLIENNSANSLSINEEIKSIDGKTVSDFANKCNFFNWFYFLPSSSFVVEKMSGEKMTINKRVLE